MLHILTNDILPVFAMLVLGFVLGRTGKATVDEARAANRIAFIVFQPALIFPLIAGLDLQRFEFGALAVYALGEVISFLLGYAAARFLFRRGHLESTLLGMAVVFVNSLLYVWPISFLIYGEAAALPVTAVVAWDASVVFASFIIAMELMAGDRATGHAAGRIVRNPVLAAIALGVAANLAGIGIPAPVKTALDFAGAAAAPLTLLALGIILSHSPIRPGPVVAGISALKLAAFPLLVWAGLSATGASPLWRDLLVLTAAGPSGMMAFSLAMLYHVRTDAIAPVIIWTSLLSLVSLSMLA